MNPMRNITVLCPDADRKQIGFIVKEKLGISVYNPYSLAAILGCPQTAIIIQMKTESELNEIAEMQTMDLCGERVPAMCEFYA